MLYSKLQGLIDSPGASVSKFDSFKSSLLSRGVELKSARFYSNLDLEAMRKDHLYLLISHLKSRFPAMGIIAAMSKIFNCHAYPEKLEDLVGYGNEELKVVLDFFGEDHENPEEWKDFVSSRWDAFKELFWGCRLEKVTVTRRETVPQDDPLSEPEYKTVTVKENVSVSEVIRRLLVNASDSRIFRGYVYLSKIFRAISVSSADAERMISKLAAIKDEQRSTLGEKYLQMSLYIVANGPDLDQADDVLTRAIYYFFGRKKRRVVGHDSQNKDNLMHDKALAERCTW